MEFRASNRARRRESSSIVAAASDRRLSEATDQFWDGTRVCAGRRVGGRKPRSRARRERNRAARGTGLERRESGCRARSRDSQALALRLASVAKMLRSSQSRKSLLLLLRTRWRKRYGK